jgi:hypothetical protein
VRVRLPHDFSEDMVGSLVAYVVKQRQMLYNRVRCEGKAPHEISEGLVGSLVKSCCRTGEGSGGCGG